LLSIVGQRFGHSRLLECLEFAELCHRLLFTGGPRRFWFGYDRCGDLVRYEVAVPNRHCDRHDDLERRIEQREPRAPQPVLENVGNRREPHPPQPCEHEPVIWIQKNHLKSDPHARDTLLVNHARRAHGAVGIRRIAEVEEELVQLPQLATGQEKPFLARRAFRRNPADRNHDDHIRGQNQQV
jgi:hypothetical protein